MITCSTSAPRHIRILWVLDQLPRSFYDPSIWYSKMVAFAKDVVEVVFPPTVHVDEVWWNLRNRPVVSEEEVDATLLALSPLATEAPEMIT